MQTFRCADSCRRKGGKMTADELLQDTSGPLRPGTALCLSGGGYRAMLFHVGAIWRLNQLGYLRRLTRVSGVSGGAITAGVLGLNWHRLDFDHDGAATNL